MISPSSMVARLAGPHGIALHAVLLSTLGVAGPWSTHSALAQEAAASVYVRADTDRTVVITPRVRADAPLSDQTHLDLIYMADIWSSASVDIRSSASKIVLTGEPKPVTERRDELRANVSHQFSDASVQAGYRYSYEPDYEAHTVSSGLTLDFADKSTTLAVSGVASIDRVGRVGYPDFWRPTHSYSLSLALTQIIDPVTLVQLVYDVGYADGFLSSPYRFVGIGTWNGACGQPDRDGGPMEYCFPEKNPEQRLRHAFVLQGRRAFSDDLSLGASYRFYLDDWNVMSHTVLADLSWSTDADTIIGLHYRFYRQSAARQYRPRFPSIELLREYYTRDKELSQFQSHRVALELEHHWPLDAPGEQLRAVLSVAPTLYLYDNFIPLTRITALEVTLSGVILL